MLPRTRSQLPALLGCFSFGLPGAPGADYLCSVTFLFVIIQFSAHWIWFDSLSFMHTKGGVDLMIPRRSIGHCINCCPTPLCPWHIHFHGYRSWLSFSKSSLPPGSFISVAVATSTVWFCIYSPASSAEFPFSVPSNLESLQNLSKRFLRSFNLRLTFNLSLAGKNGFWSVHLHGLGLMNKSATLFHFQEESGSQVCRQTLPFYQGTPSIYHGAPTKLHSHFLHTKIAFTTRLQQPALPSFLSPIPHRWWKKFTP